MTAYLPWPLYITKESVMMTLAPYGLFCNTLVVPHVVVKVVWCFAKQAVNRPLCHRWYNPALYNHV